MDYGPEFVRQILTLLSVVIGIILALGVYLADKKSKLNKLFSSLVFFSLVWIIFSYFGAVSQSRELALISNRISFAVLIPFLGIALLFALNFPNPKTINSWFKLLLGLIAVLLTLITSLTNYVVKDINTETWGNDIVNGNSHYFFNFVIILLIVAIVVILIINFVKAKEEEKRKIKFFLAGVFIFALLNLIFNILIPSLFNSYEYDYFGDYSIIIFLGFMAYSIVKHHMFNIKVILTETAAIIVNVVLVIQIFIAQTLTERILDIIFFLIVLYGSYLLVKSVQREIQQKKKFQKLTKQLEQANIHLQELDQMKTEFVSIASHELLTPISAIMGYLSMILDENIAPVENPKTKKFLDSVYASAKRLSKLVEDLLNVSRIEQGRIVIDRRAIDLVKAAKEVIAETLPKAKQKQLSIEFEQPKETIPKVFADFDKTKEILVNIIGNAIKFTKKGGITVSLSTSRDEEAQGKRGPGNYVVVSVKDTGVGIPKEEQENIFKKFSRAGRWETRDVQGTGLGLYISKSLVEVMGGKIWVDSTPGKGSTFSISLSEVRPDDKREISGDVAKLGEPEQKELVEKGEVKHTKLKPESRADDTSRRMREVLEAIPEQELKRIKENHKEK